MNRHLREQTETAAPPRRWLRRLGFGFALLLLLVGLAVLWLLHTQSGMGFVLARVQSAMDNQLSVGAASGSLAGPTQLENLRYRDPVNGVDVQISRATIDLGVLALLRGRVVIRDLEARDITLALTTVANPPDEPAKPFSLNAPIDILVDHLLIERAAISKDGQALQTIDRIDLGGAWAGPGIEIRRLEVKAPDGSIELTGSMVEQATLAGQAQARFDWQVGERAVAGTLSLRSESGAMRVDLSLGKPTTANLTATIAQDARNAWQLQVDVPAFPAQQVIPESTLGNLALHLTGEGDRSVGNLAAQLDLGPHRVDLTPLRYRIEDTVLNIEQLVLSSPAHAGDLRVSGTLQTAANPARADLVANWQGVELPADLVGQALRSHGSINLSGNTEHYAAQGEFALGPDASMAHITLDLEGGPDAITLKAVRLKQPQGGLDAQGSITLQPELAWQVEAQATRFDPGAFLAEWAGSINANLNSSGRNGKVGLEARVQLNELAGQLRSQNLAGHADLGLKPGSIIDGELDLRMGGSQIDINGKGGASNDARVRFELANLGEWLAQAGGSARGALHVTGAWPRLNVQGEVSARDLAWSDLRVSSLETRINLEDIQQPSGRVSIDAAGLNQGSLQVDSMRLSAEGNRSAHALRLDAKGRPFNAALLLRGQGGPQQWQGELASLELDPVARNLPNLSLANATRLEWNASRFALSETCLLGSAPAPVAEAAQSPSPEATSGGSNATETTRICAGGQTASNGDIDFSFQLEQLPLRMITRLAMPDSAIRLRGHLAGEGKLERKGDAPLRASATIRSASGEAFYLEGGNTPALSYSNFLLEGAMDGSSSQLRVHAELDHDGRLDGSIHLVPGSDGSQTLDGNVNVSLNSLAFLDLLSPEITRSQGRASASYTLAGTLSAPRLQGALSVEGFATEVPVLGLKVHDGSFSVRAEDARKFVLEGEIGANQGRLKISGEGGLDDTTPLRVSLRGEDVQIADIPALKLSISPDLLIEQNSEGVHASGSLTIPSANIDLAKLPGGGASAASPDVVVVDDAATPAGKRMPVNANIKLVLGDQVKLAGYGFNGNLSGNLTVIEKPGRATSGSGTLNAGGTYKAYGQDLKIETGRIHFVGTNIDNPGIDIRAVREIKADEVKAGLLVRGTAQMPVLTVFSEPAMEQSEALSYLVTGKPLSALKSGEGDMLGTAARALGTAGGDLLAKSIGGRLGVDDIGVADDATLGGAAFTIGKYLSPKLYLSYGVGIFDPGEVVTLRYLFSRHWNFEAQNATTGSRAGINYRLEK